MAGRGGHVNARRKPGPPATTLPPDASPRLDAALEALGLDLPAVARDRLLAHLALLARWNTVHNLTAVRDPARMLEQHLFDCLAVVPPLRDPARAGADRLADGAVLLDVGSGGGLPGVVLAVVAPGVQVHCVDAVAKKAAFLQQLRGELGLSNLHPHHARVESLRGLPPVSLAICRAFATLATFVDLTEPLLAPGGIWAAMKSEAADEELRALPDTVALRAAITLSVPQLDARRRLLLLERRPA